MSIVNDSIEWAKEIFLPYGAWGLFALSFLEAFIIPIPPDLLLIVLCLAKPELSLFYALIATIGSVGGGFFGYYIGYKIGRPFLALFVSEKKIDKAHRMVEKYDALAVFLGGFTPIPYKVMTVSAGIVKMKLYNFFMASLFSRGPRFFIVAILIMLYGQPIVDFINKYFNIISIVVAVLVIAGVFVWLKPGRKT